MAAQPQIGMHRSLAVLERERSMLVTNMFSGTKLKFGATAAASSAKDLLSDGKSIASSANKLAKGGGEASKAVSLPAVKSAVEGSSGSAPTSITSRKLPRLSAAR